MAKHVINIVSLLAALILLNACEKNPFSNGPIVTQDRKMPRRIKVIEIHDNINVTLVPSTNPHIEIKSGANVIDNITTSYAGDTLIIRNENSLDWMRSYDCPFDAKIYCNEISAITYKSTGTLTSTDSISGTMVTDSLGHSQSIFDLYIMGGSGDINLLLSSTQIRTSFQFGTCDVTLRGKALCNLIFMGSYGRIHAEDLEARVAYVETKSPNNCYVWAEERMTAKISNLGNVYYKGEPSQIVKQYSSKGRLIKMRPND